MSKMQKPKRVPKLPSGLLLVDKPEGFTSHDVVAKLRGIVGTKSIGHTGTLDPFATGLMVLLIGEATKLSNSFTDGDKGYKAQVFLGQTTDSWDVTGEVSSTADPKIVLDLDNDRVEQVTRSFLGTHQMDIPAFSAKKVDGKKLYEKAREGQVFELPKKAMTFKEVNSYCRPEPQILQFDVLCSKGSFIRSLAEGIGQKLGCGAYLKALRRFYSAPYRLEDALTLDQLSEALGDGVVEEAVAKQVQQSHAEKLGASFIAMADVFPGMTTMTVKGRDETLLSNGQIPDELHRRLVPIQREVNRAQQSRPIKVLRGSSGGLLSLVEIHPCQRAKVKRIFNDD